MELIQRITPREMNFIKAYIETYGDVDGDGCAVTTDMAHILRFWNTEKAALGRLFGDKLIVSRNVSITKPLDILQEDIRQNCHVWDSEGRAFYSDFLEWCREKCRAQEITYSEIQDFLDHIESISSTKEICDFYGIKTIHYYKLTLT